MNYPTTAGGIRAKLAADVKGRSPFLAPYLESVLSKLDEEGEFGEYLDYAEKGHFPKETAEAWLALRNAVYSDLGLAVGTETSNNTQSDNVQEEIAGRWALLNQVQVQASETAAKVQPNLTRQIHSREAQIRRHIEQFMEDFKSDFWGEEWLTENQYQRFIQSPAICLFSRANFAQWGIDLASHNSEIHPHERVGINFSIPVEQSGIEVLGKPYIADGNKYWTNFRMRLSVWEHLPQPPLPTDKHGFPVGTLDEIFAKVRKQEESEKNWQTLQRVEIVRNMLDAVCIELAPSTESIIKFPLYDPEYWETMAPGEGAWIKPQVLPNQFKARQEWRVAWAYPNTVLFEFATTARTLAYELGWPEEIATRAMATGELPPRAAVVISPRYLASERPRRLDRVELSIDPAVSPLAVQEIYKAIRHGLDLTGQVHGNLLIAVLDHVNEQMRIRGLSGEPTEAQRHEFYASFQWPEHIKRQDLGAFTQAYKRALKQKRLTP